MDLLIERLNMNLLCRCQNHLLIFFFIAKYQLEKEER